MAAPLELIRTLLLIEFRSTSITYVSLFLFAYHLFFLFSYLHIEKRVVVLA